MYPGGAAGRKGGEEIGMKGGVVIPTRPFLGIFNYAKLPRVINNAG